MATPFADAITQVMVEGLNPMNAVVRQFADQQVERGEVSLDDERLAMIDKIQQRLDGLKAGGDVAVITCLRKMLAKYTK